MTQRATIHHGDALDVLPLIADDSIDAVVTDPPYELGFMGRAWDASGIAYNVELWKQCYRALKPGGHLLAFGGTRTSHRLAVAVEDAGFEIRDSIVWIYGSGFPKSRNLDGDWTGWGTALKPAHEPIVVARKPLVGTVAANVLAHGTGALNIDGCRVEMSSDDREKARVPMGEWTQSGTTGSTHQRADRTFEPHDAGRWPANVVLSDVGNDIDGDLCADGCAPGCPVRELDEQSENSSRFFPVFRYQAKAPTKERPKIDGVAHPTVKPLELMRWLVRLVTQPDGLVLDPFAGSGTTAEACALEGMRCVAIEREADYLKLINARLAKHQPISPPAPQTPQEWLAHFGITS